MFSTLCVCERERNYQFNSFFISVAVPANSSEQERVYIYTTHQLLSNAAFETVHISDQHKILH